MNTTGIAIALLFRPLLPTYHINDRWLDVVYYISTSFLTVSVIGMFVAPFSVLLILRRRTKTHSHSIVPGGLLVTSYTTRFTPFTSLMIRVATWPRNFMSKG